ncbi:MAG: DUF4476 domain-containing protein, partial [Chitinophagaceae bacterium]|nr:DUF4476 domain-containing protein [Chitinophagaceae bacterium]
MKQVSILLLSLLTAVTVYTQEPGNSVTISVTGNKNLQIQVDARNYTLSNYTPAGNKTSITVSDLLTGLHSLQVSRTNLNSNRTENITSPFTLRYRFNMVIKVNEDGSLELLETANPGTNDNLVAISAANFNILLRNVRNQRSNTGKVSLVNNAFTNAKYYYSTNQVRQLLLLVPAEADRIQLAKSSYRVIADPGNFHHLYDLLKSQAGRNEMEEYVYQYYDNDDTNIAMTDVNFTALLNTIRQQWPVRTQMTSLTDAFNTSENHFTVAQARQLIQLINAEKNKLQLAKLSYRSIIDRNNFTQLYTVLNNQVSKNELDAYVKNYREEGDNNMAMTDASFTSLYRTIQQQWPVSTQVTSLTDAFSNTSNHFTSSQARQLILLVSAESNRLQLAKLSYHSITDRGNFNQLYTIINSQSGKNELEAYVNNYYEDTEDNGTVAAMTDANFNPLYQALQREWPLSAQLNSITEAFNNTGNRFTTNQAGQLIQLVSAENNRLQLAKVSYRSITDRGNFTQVYTLLTTQA